MDVTGTSKMSHPSNPPPYDAAYIPGPPHAGPPHPGGPHPVLTQPQGQIIIVPPQSVYTAGGVNRHNMPTGPSTIVCQSCHHLIETRVEIRPVFRTHACAFCLCFFGLWPCCFIPYCIPSCNNVDHFCPKCNAFIGAYTG